MNAGIYRMGVSEVWRCKERLRVKHIVEEFYGFSRQLKKHVERTRRNVGYYQS
jgi:hypothetical protein